MRRYQRTILVAILALSVPALVAAQGAPSGDAAGVAVLPFSNITRQMTDDWIGAGIAETVMSDLRTQQGLPVIGSEVIAEALEKHGPRYGLGADEGLALELGRELGAKFLVVGGYQRLEEQIRITARIVDVESGTVVKTLKLDGDMSEMFDLQDRVASGLDGGFSQPVSRRASAGQAPAQPRAPRSTSAPAAVASSTDRRGAAPPAAADPGATASRLSPEEVTGGIRFGEPDPSNGGSRSGGGRRAGGPPSAGFVPPTGSGPVVRAVRAEVQPDIDGTLDDAVWRNAARITEFIQRSPVEGAPASEDTEVYVAYDSTHMYFGVYAHFSDPGIIRANRVDRDQAFRDDTVSFYFDTFDDQQRAFVFSVNGYGVQGDALLTSSSQGGGGGGRRGGGGGGRGGRGGGGRGGGGGGGASGSTGVPRGDSSWNALYDSGGVVSGDGWTAELAIPFKSLRYPAADTHRWGFQIVRSIPSKDETVVWSPYSRDIAGFLTQMGTLDGLSGLSTSRNIELLPTFTAVSFESRSENTGDLGTDNTPEAGFNFKYGVSSDMTLDLTVNPDFSQVESDRAQIEVNQRFPVFFPELRPFFLEGQEIFSMPTRQLNLVHTRTIVDPRIGGKLTGKVGRTSVGVMFADDEAPGKREDTLDPAYGKTGQFFVGRLRYDLYPESYIGGIVTDREFLDSYSRVGGLDGRFNLGNTHSISFTAVGTDHRDEEGLERNGSAVSTEFVRRGRNLSYGASYNAFDPDFATDVGFVRRVDTREAGTDVSYLWYPESWVINWGPSLRYARNYNFDDVLEDENFIGGLGFNFARRIRLDMSVDRSMERYGNIDFQKRSYSIGGRVSSSRRVSFSGAYIWGHGIRYDENPFLGDSKGGNARVFLRPFSRLTAEVSVNFSKLNHPITQEEVFSVNLWRTFTTYQFTDRFFVRSIVEWDTLDELFGTNLLFTYRVNAGTVFYIGYDDRYQTDYLWNNSLDESAHLSEIFQTGRRIRTSRAFFMKFQYLFRY